MLWNVSFLISFLILIAALVRAVRVSNKYKTGRILNSFNTIFIGVFFAVFAGLIPMFADILSDKTGIDFCIKLIMFDAIESIQVFTLNVEAEFILENIGSAPTSLSGFYSSYVSVLFVVAPFLTFGFIISLFKNTLASFRYRVIHFLGDVYVFSELNEKSIILAESIKNHDSHAAIIFANVDAEEGDLKGERLEEAKALKSIIFEKDIASINFAKHYSEGEINFFTIGEKEGENLVQALKIIERYNQRKHTNLFVFSTSVEGEMILSNVKREEMQIRRVDPVRSLIYEFLYDQGDRLFKDAISDDKKHINAVIAGLGKHGKAMLRALAWYCQMDGYSLQIDAFDKDELAKEKISALCPELMSPLHNGVVMPDGTDITIHIHSGVNVETRTFAELLRSLPKTTFIFVCLGDDEENIRQAGNIRMLCERNKCKPWIEAVITNADENKAMKNIRNWKGQPYDIDTIGDLESSYSYEILVNSELQKAGLEVQRGYNGTDEDYYKFEYNYRSSMATAVHKKLREKLGIVKADKNALTAQEIEKLEALEHRRWNAYMWSEGYIYSGSKDPASRNELGKMHHDLIAYAELSDDIKRIDSKVSLS